MKYRRVNRNGSWNDAIERHTEWNYAKIVQKDLYWTINGKMELRFYEMVERNDGIGGRGRGVLEASPQ